MAKVGDVLLNFRSWAPDPCQTYSPPPALTGSLVSGTVTGSLIWQSTWLNDWGETLPSQMQSNTLSNQSLEISGTLPPGIIGGRVYYQLGNAQPVYESFTTLPYTLTFANQVSALPPSSSSAFNADTDGADVSAWQAYRWFAEGVGELSRIWQGVLTLTGCTTGNGQGMYVLPGQWIRVTDMWYDGWPMMSTKRATMFLYNPVPGISGYFSQEEVQYNSRVQIWPQAQRDGWTTTISSVVAPGDSVINVVNVGNYNASGGGLLSMGLVRIGPVAGSNITEVVSYIQLGSAQLLNCLRGMNFTLPGSWPAGTPVTELNLRVSGRVIPPLFTVGQSTAHLYFPHSWPYLLTKYMLAQYRRREQNDKEAAQLLQEFRAEAMDDQNSSDVVIPHQMGDTYGIETMPGGFLIRLEELLSHKVLHKGKYGFILLLRNKKIKAQKEKKCTIPEMSLLILERCSDGGKFLEKDRKEKHGNVDAAAERSDLSTLTISSEPNLNPVDAKAGRLGNPFRKTKEEDSDLSWFLKKRLKKNGSFSAIAEKGPMSENMILWIERLNPADVSEKKSDAFWEKNMGGNLREKIIQDELSVV